MFRICLLQGDPQDKYPLRLFSVIHVSMATERKKKKKIWPVLSNESISLNKKWVASVQIMNFKCL